MYSQLRMRIAIQWKIQAWSGTDCFEKTCFPSGHPSDQASHLPPPKHPFFYIEPDSRSPSLDFRSSLGRQRFRNSHVDFGKNHDQDRAARRILMETRKKYSGWAMFFPPVFEGCFECNLTCTAEREGQERKVGTGEKETEVAGWISAAGHASCNYSKTFCITKLRSDSLAKNVVWPTK